MAMSALQGGPGLPVFLPAVYKYIISKDNFSPAALTSEDIPDCGVKSLIREVSVEPHLRIIGKIYLQRK